MPYQMRPGIDLADVMGFIQFVAQCRELFVFVLHPISTIVYRTCLHRYNMPAGLLPFTIVTNVRQTDGRTDGRTDKLTDGLIGYHVFYINC